MGFIELGKIEHINPFPGYSAKVVHSENMTVTYFDIQKGYPASEHVHPNEQISSVVEGEFELTVEGETKVMKPGSVAIIPANAKHSGKSITDCRIIDVFYPVREDMKTMTVKKRTETILIDDEEE